MGILHAREEIRDQSHTMAHHKDLQWTHRQGLEESSLSPCPACVVYVKKNTTLIKIGAPLFDKKRATLLWFASGFVREAYCGPFGKKQMSGQPAKDQRSLKLPRKRLSCYLTPSGKIAATAVDKELNTRQDVLLVQLGRTKLQLTGSF